MKNKNLYIMITVMLFSITSLVYSQATSPAQPEFTKFQSVSSDNLVNTSTGAFNYNILLLTVPGDNGFDFPINMFYNSDVGYGEEASWVGYGWSLNPGAINRSKRGFPDDIKNQYVRYWTKSEPINHHAINVSAGLEIFSKFSEDESKLADTLTTSVSANITFNFHSELGYFVTYGAGLSLFGLADINTQCGQDGQFRSSLSASPMNLFIDKKKPDKIFDGLMTLEDKKQNNRSSTMSAFNSLYYNQLNSLFASSEYPSYTTKYSGFTISGRFSGRFDIVPKIGGEVGVMYSYTNTTTEDYTVKPVYGYLFSEEALDNSSAVMDYFKEKDLGTSKNDLYLGVPFSNKDMFTVLGEGVSGSLVQLIGKKMFLDQTMQSLN